MLSDIEIAQQANPERIESIAGKLGLSAQDIECYGKYKAKVPLEVIDGLKDNPDAKLILVTAMNPTPAGEGKTTVSVGLAQALTKLGKKTVLALREPSLGPVFGVKGGACGGGYSQVIPMEDINLHFTGESSRRNDRQPHLSGQRAEHRSRAHLLEEMSRHERPYTSKCHNSCFRRQGRRHQDRPLHHNRGIRSHGNILHGQGP